MTNLKKSVKKSQVLKDYIEIIIIDKSTTVSRTFEGIAQCKGLMEGHCMQSYPCTCKETQLANLKDGPTNHQVITIPFH